MRQPFVMKQLSFLSIVLLLLAACGQEEPATPAVEEQPAVEVEAVETVSDEVTADEVVEEVLEVVEESAAEPEAGEQAILLARADTKPAQQEWKFTEGEHFVRLVPTQPTLGGADKVEVAVFFYYQCPHCFTFDPIIKGWTEDKPANVRFVQIPAMFNQVLVLHGRMFYTNEVLARNGVIKDGEAFNTAVYQEIHRRNNRLLSEAAIQKLFERFGVSADDFDATWNSFEVDQKMRVAADLARRYSIASTPTIVVNGKYRTSGAEAGTYGKLLELIDELVARESIR
ncbi:MAG: thiol:disulfide interchange protein DsbA/DsbL [Gammaproteobacteria bacterium]|nr:thiol:disulfide interchange protein DsbA/DsbL [Gammaproteobacteria bacterium]MDH3414931.1 thiol:disulfide interchange protein DsbA/DsbL [Gammaproteobacteria bacterium]